eukprot:1158298-Pelagomonas_calceolata.AAC.1
MEPSMVRSYTWNAMYPTKSDALSPEPQPQVSASYHSDPHGVAEASLCSGPFMVRSRTWNAT